MEQPYINVLQVLQNIVRDYETPDNTGGDGMPAHTGPPVGQDIASHVSLYQQQESKHLLQENMTLDQSHHLPLMMGGNSSGSKGNERNAVGYSMQFQCQVPGCSTNLKELKDYHQRYRICPEHLKCDFIVKDGHKMRFCQQCGKFQNLENFDRDKRSCRERLRRHNERRRKRAGSLNISTRAENHTDASYGRSDVPVHQDLGTIADLLSYMGACRSMDEAHVTAIMDGKYPSSLRTNQEALSSAKVISMILNKDVDSISPRPLVPNLSTMHFLVQQFARIFHYHVKDLHLVPCEEAIQHYENLNASIYGDAQDDVIKKFKTQASSLPRLGTDRAFNEPTVEEHTRDITAP